jgi:nucleoside phosphorylase
MGAGNVETAINVSNVLSRRTCDLVISVGPAGNLSDQKINSCVLVKKVVRYQRGPTSVSENCLIVKGVPDASILAKLSGMPVWR